MPKKLTRKDFIARAHKKHYGRFDYTKSKYVNYDTKVIIICKIHGEFLQTPHDHLAGYGCPVCGKSQKLTTTTFIEKAVLKHSNKYIYNKVNYVDSKTKVTITCAHHGDFEQTPASHLSGRGCKLCVSTSSFEGFKEKAFKVHNKKYTYLSPPTSYKFNALIEIICPVHGKFFQKACSHLSGRGCSQCAKSGFDVKKPGLLYYIKVKSHGLYKIGITNLTVEKRFTIEDLSNIEILRTWYYDNGEECAKTERTILEEFKSFKYYGDKVLRSGNTELFVEDVLRLDKPLPVFSK